MPSYLFEWQQIYGRLPYAYVIQYDTGLYETTYLLLRFIDLISLLVMHTFVPKSKFSYPKT